jgi:hypothetical protein
MTTEAKWWLLKFVLGGAVLLFGCTIGPRLFSNIPQFPPITTGGQRDEVLNRYFQSPVREIVIVGTSLSYRLKEEYFDGHDIRNAALPGEAPSTGLAVVLDHPRLVRPKVIAVETNIMNRSIDRALVDRYGRSVRNNDFLRPLRSLAAYYQFRQDNRNAADAAARQSIMDRSPAPRHGENAEIFLDMNRRDYDQAIINGVEELKGLVARAERDGIQVLLFELPYLPALEPTQFAEKTRLYLHRTFGADDPRWLKLNLPLSDLRWDGDGQHLDDRSAVIAALALQRAISFRHN